MPLWGQDNDNEGFGFGSFDPNDREDIISRTKEALEQGLEWIGKIGQDWQGDTPNDELARGLVAVGTMMLGNLQEAIDIAAENPRKVNPLMLTLAIQAFENHMRTLGMLHSLSSLRLGGLGGEE